MTQVTRRRLLETCGVGFLAGCAERGESRLPPVRPITRGPKHHWFGYYDKLEFDPSSRFALGMEVGFEHRSPLPEDEVRIGMVDVEDGDRWTELGSSAAWGWQQGCMLQWIPGSDTEVIWNDREEGRYVSRILNVRSGARRTIPTAVYALGPDGSWAVTTDFRRLNDTRPGYGYGGIPDPNGRVLAPDDVGIWRVDLATGRRELLLSVAAAAAIPNPHADTDGLKHYFNHLLVSPDGRRLIFLHRWRFPPGSGKGFGTRMFTMGSDGSYPYVLDPYGRTSHFIWRDPEHVLAWAWHPSHGEKFYLHRDMTEEVQVVAPQAMPLNGHCTYLPGGEWILNDTYPDADRLQHPYLYELRSGRRVPLGHFYSPPEYKGEWRCDTHPRFSPDGRKVVIDSPHGGTGRQLHLIDIGEIVGTGAADRPGRPAHSASPLPGPRPSSRRAVARRSQRRRARASVAGG